MNSVVSNGSSRTLPSKSPIFSNPTFWSKSYIFNILHFESVCIQILSFQILLLGHNLICEQLEGVQQPQKSKFAYAVKTKFGVILETEVLRFDLRPHLNSFGWFI